MFRYKTPSTNLVLFGIFTMLFGLAFLRIHLRVETTLIGYEIGKLKTEESKLLEKQSQLRMHHAKLTTKDHLQLMSQKTLDENRERPLAVNH